MMISSSDNSTVTWRQFITVMTAFLGIQVSAMSGIFAWAWSTHNEQPHKGAVTREEYQGAVRREEYDRDIDSIHRQIDKLEKKLYGK